MIPVTHWSEDKMVTMKDVAIEANVSVATVSRSINNSGYVSKEAQHSINEAIQKLNYVPNEVARSLYKKTSRMIGMLIPDVTNPYFNMIVKGAEEFLSLHGYMLIVGDISENIKKEEQYLQYFLQYNISGLLIATGVNKKIGKDIPRVYLDRIFENKVYSVLNDDYYGGKIAAKSIKNSAHRVVILKGPDKLPSSKERLNGALEVLRDKEVYIFETHTHSPEKANIIAKEVLDKFPQADTILSSNDIFALSILKEIQNRDKKVPNDIQVVGYDGISFGEYTSPGLTTVAQPAEKIGKSAAEMLIKIIENKNIVSQNIKLKPKLIKRESIRE